MEVVLLEQGSGQEGINTNNEQGIFLHKRNSLFLWIYIKLYAELFSFFFLQINN